MYHRFTQPHSWSNVTVFVKQRNRIRELIDTGA